MTAGGSRLWKSTSTTDRRTVPAASLPRLNPQLTLRWIDITDLRNQQWGFITSGQCARMELTLTDQKRLRQNGYLESVAHGVMREADRVRDPVVDPARLAWVAAGKDLYPDERLSAEWPDHVVSGTTALAIHGLGEPVGALPQLSVIRSSSARRYQSRTADLLASDVPLTWDDVTLVDGLPIATPVVAIAQVGNPEWSLVDEPATYLEDVAAAAASHPHRAQIAQAVAAVTVR